MLDPEMLPDGRTFASHDPPRILVAVADDEQRQALATALRDTGYVVAELRQDDPCAGEGYDLVLADMDRAAEAAGPALLLSHPFDVAEVETIVLDLLGWDGPATLRRVPLWADRH